MAYVNVVAVVSWPATKKDEQFIADVVVRERLSGDRIGRCDQSVHERCVHAWGPRGIPAGCRWRVRASFSLRRGPDAAPA